MEGGDDEGGSILGEAGQNRWLWPSTDTCTVHRAPQVQQCVNSARYGGALVFDEWLAFTVLSMWWVVI